MQSFSSLVDFSTSTSDCLKLILKKNIITSRIYKKRGVSREKNRFFTIHKTADIYP